MPYALDCYDSISKLEFQLESQCYDMVFLDVLVGQEDGLACGKRIRAQESNIQIVYVSSHAEQVFNSFCVEPLSFLVKPVVYKDIHELMVRAIPKIQSITKCMFRFSSAGTIYSIPFESIVFFESNKRVVRVKTTKEDYSFYGKLSEVEEQLHNSSFVRCHQSYIVNMQHIYKVDSGSIVTTSGEIIGVSRGRSQAVKEKMVEYIGSIL